MDYKEYEFNEARLEKREKLMEEGAELYPYDFEETEDIADIVAKAGEPEPDVHELGFKGIAAGRIWAKRGMGKTIFMDLRDHTGKIQLFLRKNNFDEATWKIIKAIDIGDIVGAGGEIFYTKMGELSIFADAFTVLAKSVVQIPMGKETDDQVFSRASDPEIKYRERYIHWILDKEDRERIISRSKIISAIRNRMEKIGFLEVSTPTLELVYGGAEARPFQTNVWALGSSDAYMRISPELYLKRYIVAGFKKVFTICQNFRNEGIDHSHNPEFTMMEWYEAYTDYEVQMKRFEDLVSGVCEEICGSTKVTYQGTELDFATPWKRMTVLEALKEFAGIDADKMSVEELKAEMVKHDIKAKGEVTWGIAVAELFEELCEDNFVQPIFITDHPLEISPLTKVKRGDPRLVERFEPYIAKMEIGNAYSELTDPVDQVNRLVAQRDVGKQEDGQDYDNHPVDTDFIKAIGCGMPPTGGVGLGVDRLIMLLTDSLSIRDITPFPMVRPKSGAKKSEETVEDA